MTFGPKPAREDYPGLVVMENLVGFDALKAEVTRALEEIDELRVTAAAYESHICEHDYYGGSD
jgi:hypothetical protein